MRIGEVGFREGSARAAPPAPRVPEAAASVAREEGPSPFARILQGLGREVDRGERLTRRAVEGGRELSSAELIALQVGVYRYSEAVDLAAKLIDRATNGVKTVIQGQ